MNDRIIYSDLHMHGDYSDAKGSLREFVESAIGKGLDTIGFSDHSPVPFENEWSTKKEDFSSYVNEVMELKEEYRGRINILLGVELDYIDGIDVKGYMGFEKIPFDYFIGSVHYVYSSILDGYSEVDGPVEDFVHLLENGFNSDSNALISTYYSTVRKMAAAYKPDFIGHLDLIKKNNRDNEYFDENGELYRKEVNETIDSIKKLNIPVEINTGAISRGYTKVPYPSEYILKLCSEKGMEVTLNSDAHNPGFVAYGFNEMIELARKCGFDEIRMMRSGGWSAVKL